MLPWVMGYIRARPLKTTEMGGGTKARSSVLPFGDTLHYPGCGCPAVWKPHGSLIDQVVIKGVDALLAGRLEPTRPLRVAYVLPHHKVTGKWHLSQRT